METKAEIRKNNIRNRKQIAKDDVEYASERICERIIKKEWFNKNSSLFVYSACNNEVDLDKVIKEALNKGIKIAFPRVREYCEMDFFWINDMSGLQKGSYNIMEPSLDCEIAIPDENTWVLVPGVAFSCENGYRIGYGKGYYDRYLSNFSEVHTIGIAYESQLVEAWETEKNDIAMKQIITEKREVIINDKTRNIV